MHSQPGPQQLMVLFGGLVIALIVATLVIYQLQKSTTRQLKSRESTASKLRFQDENAFTLTTVKSVITQLKADQTAMQEKLAVAERTAEESLRRFELIAREFAHGLLIFDAQGFIAFSNPITRQILGVDTWSRRRYAEIFSDLPPLSDLIENSFQTGQEQRNNLFEFRGSDGTGRQIDVSVVPIRDRMGALASVVCIFRPTPTALDA